MADLTHMPRMIWIAAALLCLPLVWFGLGRLHRFSYWIDRKSEAEVHALATGGWRAVRIEPEPGIGLWGLVRPPAATTAPWVLFLPGNSTDLLAGFRDMLDRARGERDVGLSLWAWRGFEASDGVPSPAALAADAGAMWRHLVDAERVDPTRIQVWSYSLGTAPAVGLAAGLCRAGTPPARLVLLSACDTLSVRAAGRWGRLRPADRYDALADAAAVTCDVLMVHGSDDDALPIAGAHRLQQTLGGPVRLVELPGRGHADYLADLADFVWTASQEQGGGGR